MMIVNEQNSWGRVSPFLDLCRKQTLEFVSQGIEPERALFRKISSVALGMILFDLPSAFKIAALSAFSCRKNFTWHGLNPKELDSDQASCSPLLLLHGNFHTQGVWSPLAKAVQKSGLKNPLYTLNLSSEFSLSTKNLETIDEKIEEIKEDYRKAGRENVVVHLLGYSKGGFEAYAMGVKKECRKKQKNSLSLFCPHDIDFRRKDIGKIILLGCLGNELQLPFLRRWAYESMVYEIRGKGDYLIGKQPSAVGRTISYLDETHLSLPFSPAFHAKMIQILNE